MKREPHQKSEMDASQRPSIETSIDMEETFLGFLLMCYPCYPFFHIMFCRFGVHEKGVWQYLC